MHAEDDYLFRHAILREAAYQLQPPLERGALHRMALAVLEAILRHVDSADHAAQMAEHALFGREGAGSTECESLVSKEFSYLLAAARGALRRWHYHDAIAAARRAADLPGISLEDQFNAREALALAMGSANLLEPCLQEYAKAREIALKMGNESLAAGINVSQAMIELRRGRYDLAVHLATAARDDAARIGDLALEGRAHQTLGQLLGRVGSALEALQATQAAQRLYLQAGQADRASGVMTDLAVRLSELGRAAESREVAQRALARALETGDKPRISNLLSRLAADAGAAGRVEEALEMFATSSRIAAEIGALEAVGVNHMNAGIMLGHQGRHQDALDCYALADRCFVEAGSAGTLAPLANNRASELLALGRLGEAEREIALADELNRKLGREIGLWINALNHGELLRRQGRLGSAIEAFSGAANRFTELGRPTLAAFAWLQTAHDLNDVGQYSFALPVIMKADALRVAHELDVDVQLTIRAEHARSLYLCGQAAAADEIATALEADPRLYDYPEMEEVRRRIRPGC